MLRQPEMRNGRSAPQRAASLFLVALAALALGWAPKAAADTPGAYGWVWANLPTTASYTPSSSYQWNSSGASNTIVREGVGIYRVNFPNLGTAYGGNVQVTAYGSGSQHCKVQSWTPSGTTLQVRVRCFDNASNLVDTQFTALYQRAPAPWDIYGSAAYLWANQPTTSSYEPSLTYQWNSTGEINEIYRLGTGHYEVYLYGLTSSGGTLLVTAYGTGGEHCKPSYWTTSATFGKVIRVRCFNTAGTAVDTRFTLSFSRINVPNDGRDGAYVLADQPTNPGTYTPASFYNSNPGMVNISRLSTGRYKVTLYGQPSSNKTSVQLTAFDSGGEANSRHCKVEYWTYNAAAGGGTDVYVRCFYLSHGVAGTAVDQKFMLTYVTDD